jgi:hypothetical protein
MKRFDSAGKTLVINNVIGAALGFRHRGRKATIAAAVLAAVMVCASAADARHASYQAARGVTFDGRWSVVIQTERGACDKSSRVGVDIVNGMVTYSGTSYGSVSGKGALRVSLVMGDQQAQGAGHLGRTSGSGWWRGLGKVGACSGHWMAERRD